MPVAGISFIFIYIFFSCQNNASSVVNVLTKYKHEMVSQLFQMFFSPKSFLKFHRWAYGDSLVYGAEGLTCPKFYTVHNLSISNQGLPHKKYFLFSSGQLFFFLLRPKLSNCFVCLFVCLFAQMIFPSSELTYSYRGI